LIGRVDQLSLPLLLCHPNAKAADLVFIDESNSGLFERSRDAQALMSGFFFLAPNSTSRLIASARVGRSAWERRHSSTIRKKCSETRI
jgi:hypothetical protein